MSEGLYYSYTRVLWSSSACCQACMFGVFRVVSFCTTCGAQSVYETVLSWIRPETSEYGEMRSAVLNMND